jgi:phosphoesterase RecJ-like protein
VLINSYQEVANKIWHSFQESKNVGIITHQNPDGDGLAAALALKKLAESNGYKIDIILEESAIKSLNFLMASQNTNVIKKEDLYDTIILLDCHEKERVGKCSVLIDKANLIFAVDHHEINNIIPESITYIDASKVSVGAIIYDMFEGKIKELKDRDLKYVIDAIYTTILNDTDNFINANTTPDVFELCHKLSKSGLNSGEVIQNFTMSKTANEMKFVGEVLATIKTYNRGKIIFIHSTLQMLQDNNLKNDATSKMTKWAKFIDGYTAIAYFNEISENIFRLSLRSNEINVNEIAVQFGGGGHKNASGCEIEGELDKVQKIILDKFREQL